MLSKTATQIHDSQLQDCTATSINPIPASYRRLEQAISDLFNGVDYMEARIDAVLSAPSEEETTSAPVRPAMPSQVAESLLQQAERVEYVVEKLSRLACRVTL